MRQTCNCPKLPARDPRTDVARLRQLIAENKALEEAAARENKSGIPVAIPVLHGQVASVKAG